MHKNAVVSQAVSRSLLMKCMCSVFQQAAHRMMLTYQAEKGAQLCILITLGKFLCPLLACCITTGPLENIFLAFFLPEALS